MFKKIVDNIIQKQLAERKGEIANLLKSEEDKLRTEHQAKLANLSILNEQLNNQIKELERTRQKAEEEQKRLWERLDILRDSLNTEQLWGKLWECAYSKAIDMVWDIVKKEAVNLAEKAKEDGYNEAERRYKEIYEKRLNEIIASSTDKINLPLLLKYKEMVHNNFLDAQKRRDPKQQYYEGQLDLIKGVFNEKDNS